MFKITIINSKTVKKVLKRATLLPLILFSVWISLRKKTVFLLHWLVYSLKHLKMKLITNYQYNNNNNNNNKIKVCCFKIVLNKYHNNYNNKNYPHHHNN